MIIRENKVSFISILKLDDLKTGQTMHFLAVGRCNGKRRARTVGELVDQGTRKQHTSAPRILFGTLFGSSGRFLRRGGKGKRRIWVALQSRRGNESVKCNTICLPTEHQGLHKNSFRNARAFKDRSLLCILREENQQQTQPTYDAGSVIRTRDLMTPGRKARLVIEIFPQQSRKKRRPIAIIKIEGFRLHQRILKNSSQLIVNIVSRKKRPATIRHF